MKNIIISLSLVISSVFILDLSAQNLCDSLVLYYPFNGNANDSSGNGFNGIVIGATLTTDRFGNPNSAYYFHGNTDYIDLPLNPLLKPQLPFSVAFWIMFSDLNHYYSAFTSDYFEDIYTGCFVGINPNNNASSFIISYGDGGGSPNGISDQHIRVKTGISTINPAQWYHVVAVFKGPTNMDLYLNGVNDNGTYDGFGSAIGYSNNPGSIGRKDRSYNVWPPSYYYLHGKMDDIAFWNRALTQEDVTELYTVGISTKPSANFTYNIQGITVVFADQSIRATSWLWDFGDGYFSNLKNPVHAYDHMGKFYACLTVTDPCGIDQYCDTVFNCQPPNPHFTYEINDHSVSFHDSTYMPIFWYWSFGDDFFSDLQNPIHYFNNFGRYYICLTSGNVCKNETSCDSIFIQPNGISEFTNNLLEIYPNPATDHIYVKGSIEFHESGTLLITNTQGSIIISRKIEGNSNNLNFIIMVNDFESGLYYLKIILDTRVLIRKFIIIHIHSK